MQDTQLEQLILKIKEGHEPSFEKLAELYRPLIQSIAKSFNDSMVSIGSEDMYGDLVQELTYALYKSAVSYDTSIEGVTFGLYAKRCLRNKGVSVFRKVKSGIRKDRRVKEKLKNEGNAYDAFRDMTESRRDSITADFAKILSDLELRVFTMYLDGAGAGEIASAVGISEKSVNNAVYRAKSKIKKFYHP